jgi:streptogramin lyase
VRRVAALLILAASLGAAGCGGSSAGKQEHQRPAVRAVVDLSRPRGGPPDAGVAAGHGGDVAVATTHAASLAIHGFVTPQASVVVLTSMRTRRARTAWIAPDGRFTVVARGLQSGLNPFVLEARRAGYAPWRLDIRITRR